MLAPDISVIVPVHNSSKYLEDCLNSLLNQSHKNIEIICINDGSYDNSGQILKEYAKKDNRIKIKTTECHGVGNARNVGIDSATGKYVFFMDSDDLLHREALSKFIDIAKKTNADIIGGKYKKLNNPSVKDERKLTGVFFLEKDPISCFAQRPPKTPITVWNKLFKRDVIGKSRFLPRVYYEDTAFTLEIFSNARSCALTPDVTYLYRTGNNSIMRSNNTEQKINDFCKVLKEVDKTFKQKPEVHQLIFSTYLNPDLLTLLIFRFWMSRHLRKYMSSHIQPIIKSVKKTQKPELEKKKNFSKTQLFFRILKEKICKN